MKAKKDTRFLVESRIKDEKIAQRVVFMQSEEEPSALCNETLFLKNWNKTKKEVLNICGENLSKYCQMHLDNTFYPK